MSGKTLNVKKKKGKLLLYYAPAYNFEEILQEINENGISLKKTFWFEKEDIVEVNEDNNYICFQIGELKDGLYRLNSNVFGCKHNIYIQDTLTISEKWFIAYPNISIVRRIDALLVDDLYIIEKDDGLSNRLPYEAFINLLEAFPNSYELQKYSAARISHLLSEYIEGIAKHKDAYEIYLEKKENRIKKKKPINIKSIGLEMYQLALETLEKMLDDPEPYTEKDWQERIYEIICVLYPKYIHSFREIEIGTDGRHKKTPDFLLVDSSGFVDILEIKKPDKQKVVSLSEYRNNYVAGRDLEGAIVQIEKYIYILNHEGEDRVNKIRKIMFSELPDNINVKVVNPQGILILGRSDTLTDPQRFDFEIIKRQHKNIVDIMTYDDLLDRLKNILGQMKGID